MGHTYYYAVFNAPCVGHKDDESHTYIAHLVLTWPSCTGEPVKCFDKYFFSLFVKSRETIAECMRLFNCQSVKHVASLRGHNFIQE